MADTEKVGDRRRQVLLVAGVVLVLAAGIGWRLLQPSDTEQTTPTTTVPKVVSNLEKLRDKGDEAGFNAALQTALQDASLDSDTRYLVYTEEGHNAMKKQQWQAAIDAYAKAMAIKQDKEVAALLGDAYAALGNKAKAVAFYEQAISLVPSDHPNRDGIIEEYRQRIQTQEEGA